MDSYRDTTVISEDESEDESSIEEPSYEEESVVSPVVSPKKKNYRRIISDSESDDDYEKEEEEKGDDINEKSIQETEEQAKGFLTDDDDDEDLNGTNKSMKHTTSRNISANLSRSSLTATNLSKNFNMLDEEEEKQDHPSEDEEQEQVPSDEEEDADTELANDFKSHNMFNSTVMVDLKKPFESPNFEPMAEEEEMLMTSIHEQVTGVGDASQVSESIINSTESERRSSVRISNAKSTVSDAVINSSDDSVKIVQQTEDEIIISSDEDEGVPPQRVSPFKPMLNKPNMSVRQITLPQMIKKESPAQQSIIIDDADSPEKKKVSRMEYIQLKSKLENLHVDKRKIDAAIATIQLSKLPDQGKALLDQQKEFVRKIKAAQDDLSAIEIKDEPPPQLTWRGIEAGTNQVQPLTFGKQAMQTYNNERALTLDRLHNLHNSLKSCPTPETLADDPRALKVELMLHQKHALAWLMWRESQKPAGGILADDMGLGKTLTMISLIAAHNQLREEDDEDSEESDRENENEDERNRFKYNGGTLIVCPASLLGQWVHEVEDKLKPGSLTVETYHGPKREKKERRLAKHDMVVTTYAICQSEGEMDTPLYRIKWERIILDEAHQIRNHKSKTSVAVFRLGAKRRWALTGTPVHNKEMDLFALLKFLRCSPFDDINIFKRWVSSKNGGGNQRLHTVLSSLLLRRTKEQLKEMDQLTCLPEREWKLVEISMDKDEMEVYQKILLFSKTLFAQFLHQRAEKNADMMDFDNVTSLNDPSNEYYKMHKKLVRMNKLPDVKQSDILVLLLRLRQICCHPSLITAMLDNVADLGDEVDGSADVSMDLLDQLNKLNIDDNEDEPDHRGEELNIDTVGGIGLAEASRNLLNPSNPIFEKTRQSAKVREVIKLLQEKIMPSNDKTIIVSQWTSLLHLMVPHLDDLGIKYCNLDGTVPVKSRGEIVFNFNNKNSGIQIMLLSLTAGGVGLNLVGANHLIFLDLHWNPQLEMQAQDRIYRVGQRKKVFVYKFMTVNTIEQRIKCLQDKKKEIADAMLKGAKLKNNSKLSMDDLKMLFNM